MNKRILNLVKQMGEEDKKHLYQRIQSEYALKEKNGMLRDDIRDKIFEIIKMLFADYKFVVQEHLSFAELNMDAIDVTALVDAIMKEFDLEAIEFSNIMEWQRVADIINYIEDTNG